MFHIGQYQRLIVDNVKRSGFYLKVPGSTLDVDILLPGAQAPPETRIGDELDVFIYRDSEDRLIATTHTPKVTLDRLARLTVVRTTEIGAFLEWGLERDLLLPFSEQLHPVEKGDEVLIRLYLDKTERLCATMKTQKGLSTHPPFKIGEQHEATVYRFNDEIGLFVAVEDRYDGLVLKQDIIGRHRPGDRLTLFVSKIDEEGKLQMRFRQGGGAQRRDDAETIFAMLEQAEGFLPYHDNTDPETIRKVFGMSKKSFKRAVGTLLKSQKIRLDETGIHMNRDA